MRLQAGVDVVTGVCPHLHVVAQPLARHVGRRRHRVRHVAPMAKGRAHAAAAAAAAVVVVVVRRCVTHAGQVVADVVTRPRERGREATP